MPDKQQQPHIEQAVGADQHEVGRLLPLLAIGIDIGDAGRDLAVLGKIDLGHLAFGARLEGRLADQRRQHAGLRRGL